jgi:hypothetical protein
MASRVLRLGSSLAQRDELGMIFHGQLASQRTGLVDQRNIQQIEEFR